MGQEMVFVMKCSTKTRSRVRKSSQQIYLFLNKLHHSTLHLVECNVHVKL